MKKFCVVLFSLLFLMCAFALAASAQTDKTSDSANKQANQEQENAQPLKIISKPNPRIGDCPRQSSGLARLRVTFDKTVKITNVEIFASSGCDDFDRNADRAARLIKFEPARKNGEPITVVKLIEYKFERY